MNFPMKRCSSIGPCKNAYNFKDVCFTSPPSSKKTQQPLSPLLEVHELHAALHVAPPGDRRDHLNTESLRSNKAYTSPASTTPAAPQNHKMLHCPVMCRNKSLSIPQAPFSTLYNIVLLFISRSYATSKFYHLKHQLQPL